MGRILKYCFHRKGRLGAPSFPAAVFTGLSNGMGSTGMCGARDMAPGGTKFYNFMAFRGTIAQKKLTSGNETG